MTAMSNYLEGKVTDHFLRGSPVTSPGAVYLALFESDPGEDGSGTETSYTNYARQLSTWTALDGNGQTKNVDAVAFPANGNAAADVTLTHGAIYDAAVGGNLLFKGPLASTKTLSPGDVVAYAANALAITLN